MPALTPVKSTLPNRGILKLTDRVPLVNVFASKNAESCGSGTDAPVAPPVVADHFELSEKFIFAAGLTAKRFTAGVNVIPELP